MKSDPLSPGTLYLIPTPIGNLGDITLRAIETMKSVDFLLAEDTRTTRKLMTHFGIKTPFHSYDSYKERKDLNPLLEMLKQGKTIGLVSEAGMPGISDPGIILALSCNENGIPVRVLPGASAGITAVVSSGFQIKGHLFEGFLPRTASKMKERMMELAEFPGTVVIYEAPHCLLKLMEVLSEVMPQRGIHIAREMTKLHEEHIHGIVRDVFKRIRDIQPRGEYVIILSSLAMDGERELSCDERRIVDFMKSCMEKGLSRKDAADLFTDATGTSRSAIYKIMNRAIGKNQAYDD
jgi:16S rRNA (cytidine1402-2'-O)-methyltransferase